MNMKQTTLITIIMVALVKVPSVIQKNGRYVLEVQEGCSAEDIGNALYEWVQANPELK